jgi:hypothetical protein
MTKRFVPLIPVLLTVFLIAAAPVAFGFTPAMDLGPEVSVASMFQVNAVMTEGSPEATEALPKILYLITLQVAVLLSLFFYRVSKLSATV